MATRQDLLGKLRQLLEHSESVKLIKPEKYEEMKARLEKLPVKDLENVLLILENEQAKVQALQNRIQQADEQIVDMLKQVKQAGMTFQKAFLAFKEVVAIKGEEKKSAELLKELDKMP